MALREVWPESCQKCWVVARKTWSVVEERVLGEQVMRKRSQAPGVSAPCLAAATPQLAPHWNACHKRRIPNSLVGEKAIRNSIAY